MHGCRKTLPALLALLLIASPLAGGCTPRVGGSDYAVSGAQGSYDVEYGTVVSFRHVRINDENSGKELIGAGAGGVLGGVLGNAHRRRKRPHHRHGGRRPRRCRAGRGGSQQIGNQTGVEVVVRARQRPDSGRGCRART